MKTTSDGMEKRRISKVSFWEIVFVLTALSFPLLFFCKFKFIDEVLDFYIREFPAATSFALGLLGFIRMIMRIQSYRRSDHGYHIAWAILSGLLSIYLMYVSFTFMTM